jgi:hypothetical protein
MLEKYCNDFLEKSVSNFKLYEHLQEANIFIEWQAVTIFYSTLCIAKAYLYSKGFPINSINSHDNIKFCLASEQWAKQSRVLDYYETLYRNSRDARYTAKKITKANIECMLVNHSKVRDLLKIEFI